ncbi:hypothetical protein ABZ154_01425 [Streptomyces sp. NPDC006261]|uniref:hypothetical protein n=1 Tax=Streptomyces sp. NPDC006261 TaxID=3156739 RepID=UPI0033B112CA
MTALTAAALFATHGPGFAALRLTGRPWTRAHRLVRRTGAGKSLALTAVLMGARGALPPFAGPALRPAAHAADRATLILLVPVLLALCPLLVAAQAWTWHTFRHRVTHPSYL